ncbi:transposase-like protein [Salinibacter ruber]|uniref:Mutator family transposase n=1 Tax=Salinibacter ruber TaxID=146919 RepID=A0A9X2UPB4_9BACT|nr:transposase-like protein [Salinibacter ruber]MCS3616917.1 transposase-like protein [Salinibacter ruber]MCS3675162.1 transposase-like protein [Salinibacter ruber]MCS3785092.1 transposase-like protein [Salinibacter ruber]MCS4038302.1 transposase-like protein [Salinibacter ruber]
MPRCKDGSFSTKLFQRYQHAQKFLRVEKALVLAPMEKMLQGVSTRRVKKITTELCGREFSKSTVSRLTKKLDATCVKVRSQGAVRSTAVLLAVGTGEKGQREILGLHVVPGETEEAWRSFLKQLSERGLTGVEHVTSDRDRGAPRRQSASSYPS